MSLSLFNADNSDIFRSWLDLIRSNMNTYRPWTRELTPRQLDVDLHTTADGYVAKVDVPGVNREDVKVEVEDNMLTISVTRKSEVDTEDDEGHHYIERSFGTFSRSIYLPEDTNGDSTPTARLENGVLNITIKRNTSVENKKKTITVQ